MQKRSDVCQVTMMPLARLWFPPYHVIGLAHCGLLYSPPSEFVVGSIKLLRTRVGASTNWVIGGIASRIQSRESAQIAWKYSWLQLGALLTIDNRLSCPPPEVYKKEQYKKYGASHEKHQ